MRILILGGNGMLGHQLLKRLCPRHDVRVTLRQKLFAYSAHRIFTRQNSICEIDLRDASKLRAAFEVASPETVINAAGILKQRDELTDKIIEINSLLPHRAARLCREIGARFVHVSTDCVFSGVKGNYCESDLPDALDLYGRSKLLGEVTGPHCLTLRTSMIGRELARKSSLFEWFLAQQGEVRGFTKAVFSGFTTLELARIIEKIIAAPNVFGLYHLASEPIAKYDLLGLVKKKMALDVELVPDDSVKINRSLDGSRFNRDLAYQPPSWDEMIDEL